MDEASITIVGAGVVGLALAAELSKEHEGVVVLERHDSFGQETSSRNSEVIHAGIYYPPGSLKARLCVEGANLIYGYAEANSIPHRRTGKLIVASVPDEIPRLEGLIDNGTENGVAGLRIIGAKETVSLEPAVRAAAALYSPDTGIIDTHSLMASLYREAESRGALFSMGSELDFVEKDGSGFVVGVRDEGYRFRTRVLVNSAGLSADEVASLAGIDIDEAGYRLRYCKGSYFSYAKPSPVSRLVYPVPHEELAGLGVHATLDMAGRLRFGPDAEFTDIMDYRVDAAKRDAFFEGASRIISGLDIEAFAPDMAGMRPKLKGPGVRDFIIRHEADRSLDGLIDLVGIESPGLTASLAIARHVARMVKDVAG